MAMPVMNTTMMMMMNSSGMDHMHHHDHGDMGMTTQNPHHGHGHGTTEMDHSGHGQGGGGMDHTGHGAGTGHTMQMYFHTGLTEYILFESLYTSNVGAMVGACVAMFALSVMYEGLKYFREYLLHKVSLNRRNVYTTSTNGENVATKQPEVGARMLSGSHAIQTLLHMVQVFVSYCLMLVFMTYNVYLCIAIVVGAGLGYFLFGWRRATVVDMNEHCH